MIAGAPSASVMRTFEPVLDRLRADAGAHFGAREVCLAPVGHEERPFSFLLRVAVWTVAPMRLVGHAFLKIFKPKDPSAGIDLPGRVAKEYHTARAVHEFLSRWDDVGVVRPIACYTDLLAIVTEEAPGPTLLDHLTANAGWFQSPARLGELESTMHAVGRWLARFHGFEAGHASVDPSALLEYVDVRLRRLVKHDVFTEAYRGRVLRHLNRLGDQIEPASLREVAVHADFALGNILLCGTRVVVLDFAMAGRGSYLHDVSRLYLQIEMLRAKPRFRPRTVAALQAALLAGAAPGVTARDPMFRYLLMLHRINHLGTLAMRRERLPALLLSARMARFHRRRIDGELAASGKAA